MSLIPDNLQAVHEQICAAARSVARDPGAISLLVVSKSVGTDAVIEAAKAGQRAFGENYLQEAMDKMAAVRAAQPNLLLEWHFIGPIQSNKTRLIAEHFDWVHSVGREKVAKRLAEQRPAHLSPLNVCLQVNVSGESSKSGVAPDQLLELAKVVACLPHLRLRGLMAIPEQSEMVDLQRGRFRQMRQLFDILRAQGMDLDTLSMGMSADMGAAIVEGSTMVRVGTAIFGKRHDAK